MGAASARLRALADASHVARAGHAEARAPRASVAGIASGNGAVTAGGVVSVTTTRVVDEADAPWLSVTVSVTSWAPSASVVEIDAAVPSTVLPSVHRNVRRSPASGSEPEPESVTVAPAGDVASNGAYVPAFAVGALFDNERATTNGESDDVWPQTVPLLLPAAVMFTQLPDSKCRS